MFPESFKKQLYDELDRRIGAFCSSVISAVQPSSPSTSTRGRKRGRKTRQFDLRAFIQKGFRDLRRSCLLEIDRRVDAFAASIPPEPQRVTTGDSTAQTDRAATNQDDSGSCQAGISDATQAPDLSASLSRPDEHEKDAQTPGSPSVASSRSRNSDNPLLAVVGDAISDRISPGLSAGTCAPGQSSGSGLLEAAFRLDSDGLGDRLIPNLEIFMSEPKFAGIVLVKLDASWERLAENIRPPRGHDMFAVRYTSLSPGQDGVSKLLVSESRTFRPPNLNGEVVEPSQEAAEAYYNGLVNQHPSEDIPYYVGPLPSSELDSLFPPGNLSKLDHIPGVNSLYAHWGEKGSGTAFHCEDAGWSSFNLVLSGYKFWILIAERHTAAFEALVRRCADCGCSECDQFVRHPALLFSLERLRNEGIDFEVVIAGPGVMVVTRPRQYHCVVNLTACLAIAINFVLHYQEIIPRGLVVCPRHGLYPLDDPSLTKIPDKDSTIQRELTVSAGASLNKRNAEKAHTHRAPKRQKPLDAPHVAARADACSNPESPNVAQTSRVPKPQKTLEAPRVATLADACSSPEAFRRLRLLVWGWRNRTLPLMQVDHSKDIAPQLVKIIGQAEAHTSLSQFISRFAKGKLALEATKAYTTDYKRAPPQVVDDLLKALGWTATKPNRTKLHYYLRLGREWNQLCRDDELLCLVPTFTPGSRSDSSTSDYLDLVKSKGAVKQFQDGVSATSFGRALLHMAGIFQEAVWLGQDPPLFRWEDWEVQRLDKMSRAELEPLMEIFPTLTAQT